MRLRGNLLRCPSGFTAVYFKEPLSLTQGAGFALIALGAMVVFRGQA